MNARFRPKVILAYKSLVTELTALFYLAAWLAVLGLAFTYGMNLAITADMTVVRSSSQTCSVSTELLNRDSMSAPR